MEGIANEQEKQEGVDLYGCEETLFKAKNCTSTVKKKTLVLKSLFIHSTGNKTVYFVKWFTEKITNVSLLQKGACS